MAEIREMATGPRDAVVRYRCDQCGTVGHRVSDVDAFAAGAAGNIVGILEVQCNTSAGVPFEVLDLCFACFCVDVQRVVTGGGSVVVCPVKTANPLPATSETANL